MPISTEDATRFAQTFAGLVDGVSVALLDKVPTIRLALTTMLAGGHLLLEDAPGTGKTALARAMAAVISGSHSRIQFTPDLLPSDITGVSMYDQKTGEWGFHAGPVFAQIVLADEINRASPKTQSALLEVMEESQVTVGGTTYPAPRPFMVMATQNPVEQAGTYPLPEAQLDRFLLKLELPLPGRDAEFGIVKRHRDGFNPLALADAGVRPVASPADIAAARGAAARVDVSDTVLAYLVDVCRATRESPSVRLGASPRGATALLRTTRVWAFLQGRGFATPDDVKAMAAPTLAHRIGLRAEADLEGLTAARVVEGVLAQVPVPR